MNAKTLIDGLAARAAELGASTENKTMKTKMKFYRIKDANAHIDELEKKLAQKSSSGAAADSVFTKNLPDAPISGRTAVPASSPLKAARPDREMMLEIIQQIFPLEAVGRCEDMPPAKLWSHVQKLVWQAGLKLPAPFAISDSEMEAKGIWRPDPKAAGVSRYHRAEAQSKIDYIFNVTKL